MNPRLETLTYQFSFFTPRLDAIIGKLQPEHLAYRPTEHDASLHWLIGHIIIARNTMTVLCGNGAELPDWKAQFGRGSGPEIGPDGPDIAELTRVWKDVCTRLTHGLATVTDVQLDNPPPMKTPFPMEKSIQFLSLLMIHDTYHIGQVGQYHKHIFGKPMFG